MNEYVTIAVTNCENSPKKSWPASSIWVFIAQLGEHCNANAEATGSNPVEAPKNFFSGYFRNCLNCDSLRWSHTHSFVFPQFTSFDSVFKDMLIIRDRAPLTGLLLNFRYSVNN